MPSALRSARTPSPFRSRLYDAVEAGKTDDVYALLAGDIDECVLKSANIMRAAVRRGNADVVHMLLRDGRFVPDTECIQIACSSNDVDVLIELIDDGRAVPDTESLCNACTAGNLSAVQLLLDEGRAVPSFECIDIARSNRDVDMVAMLIDDGRVPPSSMYTLDVDEDADFDADLAEIEAMIQHRD